MDRKILIIGAISALAIGAIIMFQRPVKQGAIASGTTASSSAPTNLPYIPQSQVSTPIGMASVETGISTPASSVTADTINVNGTPVIGSGSVYNPTAANIQAQEVVNYGVPIVSYYNGSVSVSNVASGEDFTVVDTEKNGQSVSYIQTGSNGSGRLGGLEPVSGSSVIVSDNQTGQTWNFTA